jgi:folate-binding protein YgfZ
MIIQAMDTSTTSLSGIAALKNLGVIRAAGEDAIKFLQGQLTQDVALMRTGEAHLAAFCNAKGRMQASFVVFKRSEDEILMVCSADILQQTLKRLSMFVLRAKVKLLDASAEFSLFGLVGSAMDAIESVAANARIARIHWSKLDFEGQNLVFLYPGAGFERALWCAPAATLRPVAATLAPGIWEWLEVQSGIAMITTPIFEAFVPQMLNYESVGGVNFKKGCYPGQEIVARSQFRGTLKRRAYLVHGDTAMTIGQQVFHVLDAEQPCGMVAACAAHPEGGFDAIVSMQTAAALDSGNGRLMLGSAGGAALTLLALPYPLLEDI